ncbi:uncharacterized protein LOC107361550 isoform X1 [Tetranychus urticae]|uniref:uncharacterized protein LOC107361550 isoform X1 n=1 Tax=Tetranychus urticae TaxID=32264 RepID=UPI00077B8C86|nr:uncharacterized protein LOC107361550 isoform X1 [Tetranychus urticae]
MFINELPDDCLLTIVDYLNNLEDLANCYKVCIKWSHLIAERTRKVKYFMVAEISEDFDYSSDLVYYQGPDLSTRYKTLLSTLFSNLPILHNPKIYNSDFIYIVIELLKKVIDFEKKEKELGNETEDLEKLEQFFFLKRHLKSLKGIINCCDVNINIEILCDKPEMVSSSRIEPGILKNGSSIKQLHTWYDYEDFETVAHHFPNLERLHIYLDDSQYKGPVLEKLKILELKSSTEDDFSLAFRFLDSCPNLQSAHITVDINYFSVKKRLKNESLQDLVIDYTDGPHRVDWNDLERAFIKYPNLKHLSLRSLHYIKDEHIEQLVPILPNLVLFDIYNCPAVTQKAADYVQDYCKRYGRSIKFYFKGNRDELVSDWPQLSTRIETISQGFDFMKHCFLKDFDGLPHFLVPKDY